MVREPDATRQPAPHDEQLMSKHRVLSLKPSSGLFENRHALAVAIAELVEAG
jgi:hypothetical protein